MRRVNIDYFKMSHSNVLNQLSTLQHNFDLMPEFTDYIFAKKKLRCKDSYHPNMSCRAFIASKTIRSAKIAMRI